MYNEIKVQKKLLTKQHYY